MKELIGLVLAHHVTNYGALLQAYAVQQAVESLGFATEIIDYKANRFRRGIKFDFGLFAWFYNSYKNSRKKKKTEPLDEIHLLNKAERKKRFTEFNSERLQNRHTYNGIKAIRKAARHCKAVLIGSDQMWLPGTSFGNYQSLRFVPNDIRTISYATSLGVSQYPKYCYRSARDMWENIDYLSVREQQGKDIIQTVCNQLPVEVVCDPTYLFNKEEWERHIPKKSMTNEKYVLCYFLGNSDMQQRMAKQYAEQRGLKCYSILSDESVSSIDTTFPDKVITGASVDDFVNWIRGAECLITDSFHGLAFAVINNKDFYIFYRKRDEARVNRNARIDNILNMWQCEDRLVENDVEQIKHLPPIDYDKVNALVDAKREMSWSFLRSALTF